MVNQVWKIVPGVPTLEASSLGAVRRRLAGGSNRAQVGLLYKLTIKTTGSGVKYAFIRTFINGRRRSFSVHRLVCAAFHGRCPNGKQAAHWDGNSLNNKPRNLRWATPVENTADKARHGRVIQGEAHHLSKLRSADIPIIRKLLKQGIGQREIAKMYGVSQLPIFDISKGKSWKSV